MAKEILVGHRTISPQSPAHPSNTDQTIFIGNRKVERIFEPNFELSEDVKSNLMSSAKISKIEVCGFITAAMRIHIVQNLHEFPENNFYMDPNEGANTVSRILQTGHRIIGLFHTHPNNIPWPSPRDIVGWPNPKLNWRYWIATSSDVIEWRLA